MIKDVEIVKNRLIDGDFTCVIHINGTEFASKERGVKPLINFLQSGKSFFQRKLSGKISLPLLYPRHPP
jgi:hypothetical protein